MKLLRGQRPLKRLRARAFALIDAIFAMALAGVMFAALYAGLAFGFNIIKMARENTRATQIMLEHMEIIRLYTWEQLTNTGAGKFLPTNKFTVPYYAIGGTNSSLLYTARIQVASAASQVTGVGVLPAGYVGDMRKVTVQLEWGQLGNSPRKRSMSTYVTRNGLQKDVWYQ